MTTTVSRGPAQQPNRAAKTPAQQQVPQQHLQHRAASHHHQHNRRRPGPLNVTTGSRVSPHGASSRMTSSSSSAYASSRAKSTVAKVSISHQQTGSSTFSSSQGSLPALLASLSGGFLIAAAAMHFCGPDQPEMVTSAVSAVSPLQEFGPADIVSQAFGPSRPIWALLLHSHQSTSAAAAAAAAPSAAATLSHATAAATVAATATAKAAAHHSHALLQQHFRPFVDSGADGDGLAASLVSEARDVATGAATAVRGAMGGLCDDYNRWLAEDPLVCKVVTGNFFTVAGDMLAQLGLGGAGGHGGDAPAAPASTGGRRHVDWWRTGRLCLETSAFGTPLAHWWFNFLDTNVMPDNPHCPAAVMTKMLADQVLFAPLGLLMFFAVIKCLEGRPRDIPHTIRTSYVKSLLGGYLLWPAAGILNFALLPPEYRVFFNNCVNIIWTCFLSIMSSGNADDASDKPAEAVAAAAALPSASTTSADPAAAALAASSAPASPCVATCVANDLATAAVAAAVIGAAAGGSPAFGCVAGIAVAAVGASMEATHGSVAQKAAAPQPALAANQLVSGGLGSELYGQQGLGVMAFETS
ncbi:hypothetical protein PLESTB_001161000 [Pleodorina starrii]|uniref:Uncharacterized protein n=1 Tax=Pleodorina starrii TaxID=330485 RepID=A0A9W6BRI0_9CHLO|nr:hypothetical protein PLESTM_000237400 [Pleodorina starrii]GLC56897.1 hypothetical protein PLESTB_001161000 [Pleodorina starrii]GLC64735.1 hypothetical protein PLESTF_000201800 [Pleodorina starrii]